MNEVVRERKKNKPAVGFLRFFAHRLFNVSFAIWMLVADRNVKQHVAIVYIVYIAYIANIVYVSRRYILYAVLP